MKERLRRRNAPRVNKSVCLLPGMTFRPTPEELQFLEAAEYGDIPSVERLLKESHNLNVNCVDYMGQNALQIACGNEHLEVVEMLIKQPSMKRIGDALLLSISRGFLRITEAILSHNSFSENDRLKRSPSEQKTLNEKDSDFYAYDDEGTRFSPDITPIILAAQCQEFDIVHVLLRKGASIAVPHSYRCQCKRCIESKNSDSLSYCLSRLNAYKGLASPAYLSMSTSQPALQAFKLSHRLKKLSSLEKEFKNDYVKLSQQCNDFVERLLDCCHNSEEVDIMLNGQKHLKYDDGKNENNCWCCFDDCTGDTETNPQLRQLRMAIKYGVKKFVAHSYCQQKVIGIWYKDYEWFAKKPFAYKIMWFLFITVSMPIFALIYLINPSSQIGRLLQTPFCKFVTQAIAYGEFVILLIFNCIDRAEGIVNIENFAQLGHQWKSEGRYTKFNWCEITLMLFITGLLWNEVKELWSDGAKEYMFKLWNIVDFFMLLILISSFTCRAIAYQKAISGQEWWDNRFGPNATQVIYNLSTDTTTLFGEYINITVPSWAGYYAYSRTNRRYWYGTDPQLIAEALYSLGIVLSFSRISYILEINDKFGPLQISLARTVGDIFKWCVIFFMIFGAFLLGLFNLYSYYGGLGAKRTRSFTTLEETFITLFWSIFGLAEYRGVEINYDHELTRVIGYQLYGAYNIIMVIVMLNMLIAMINSSYSEVEGDQDVEWKFARADLMLSYFEKGNALPVPYNLIPMPKACLYFGRNLFLKTKKTLPCIEKTDGKRFEQRRRYNTKRNESDSTNKMERSATSQSSKSISRSNEVMSRIVKRYILRAQVEKSKDAEITEIELQEIKHDISSLRYEIIGTTKRTEEKMNEIIEHFKPKREEVEEEVNPMLKLNHE